MSGIPNNPIGSQFIQSGQDIKSTGINKFNTDLHDDNSVITNRLALEAFKAQQFNESMDIDPETGELTKKTVKEIKKIEDNTDDINPEDVGIKEIYQEMVFQDGGLVPKYTQAEEVAQTIAELQKLFHGEDTDSTVDIFNLERTDLEFDPDTGEFK